MNISRSHWLVLAFMVSTSLQAAPLAMNVTCNNQQVGTISVDVQGDGVKGSFTSTFGGPPPTLAAAAAQCNEHHFNWYQIVQGTHPLIPGGGPQVDPLPGGQGGQWADMLPWYWDEYAPPANTPGYDAGLQLSAHTTADKLNYEDYPFGPVGTTLTFHTWLVSLNADGSFHGWHPGFTWTWSRPDANTINVGAPTALNADPTNAQYQNLIGGFYTSIPEPGTNALAGAALGALLLFAARSHGRSGN